MKRKKEAFKYPGIRAAMDGNSAAIMCERESTDGAGAYPITPSTQMGEYWAEAAAAQGHINVSGRPLDLHRAGRRARRGRGDRRTVDDGPESR